MYRDCRGFDCVKAKGVQWVRLSLNPPTADNTSTDCDPVKRAAGQGCPAAPTSEAYVNVFNTHLNAGGDPACDDAELRQLLLTLFVWAGPVNPLIATGLEGIIQGTLRCAENAREVQRRQLRQMSAFVERIAGADPRHLSIISGDFNTNGRLLNRSGDDPSYGDILAELGIGPTSMDRTADAPDDLITPLPGAFSWDIDHGDVARETSIDWLSEGFGTGIGKGDDAKAERRFLAGRDCDLTDDPATDDNESDQRIDYILVRTAARPDTAEYEYPLYTLRKGADPVWQAPWPGAPGHMCRPVPERFSDHRPLVASLELVPLRDPPLYHPNRPHDFTFRVTSIDASGLDDCFLGSCNPIDPFVSLVGRRELPSGAIDEFLRRDSSECEGWTLSFPAEACMTDWTFTDLHVPMDHAAHMGGVKLREADSTSGVDTINTMSPGDHPLLRFRWADGFVSLRDFDTMSVVPDGWSEVCPADEFVNCDRRVFNNDPVQHCTRDRPKHVCLELGIEERRR
jgi:hypothetical protein